VLLTRFDWGPDYPRISSGANPAYGLTRATAMLRRLPALRARFDFCADATRA
jgi:hypothetical protein